jgi:signal transduction histidine kinase
LEIAIGPSRRFREARPSIGTCSPRCPSEYDFAAADVLLDRYREEGVVDLADHLLAEPARMKEMIDAIQVTSANDRALEIFGIDREAQVATGAGWLWTPGGYPVVARAVAGRYMRNTMPPVDARIRRMDGRDVDVTFTIWAEPERRPDQPVLCGIVDISDRVESQQRLERVRTEFAHASRIATLGELAASVAHEISQPLSAVISNVEIGMRAIDRDPLDVALLTSLLRHTLSAGRRAADIVSTIRSVAAPTAPARALLMLSDVVQEALSFVNHELQHANVGYTVEFAPDLPCVTGDRVQLQQVVVNLVLNAAQALQSVPEERRRLVLTTSLEGEFVELAVEDTGGGFPVEHEQKLFDSFYTTKPAGMGIGLAVCRSIAESLGGTIKAVSLPAGARFVVSIPVAERTEAV